jgi:pectate lyase
VVAPASSTVEPAPAPSGAGGADSEAPATLDEPDAAQPDSTPGVEETSSETTADGGDLTPRGASECPDALVGWASQSGDGVTNTTGGGELAPTRASNAQQLQMLAQGNAPQVIEFAGTIDVSTLNVGSNKTLRGIGQDATIRGGVQIHGSDAAPITNVILQNFRVDGAASGMEDAVQVQYAHHLWIDHVEIWDGSDGNLDMTHGVNWVTVSWCKFHYTSNYMSLEDGDHRFSNLIGHSDDNAREDDGRLKISLHHNWWAEGVIERMPRVRFGQVHVFNNYFDSSDANYCVRAGRGAHLLIENNYFDGVDSPHQFNNSEDEGTAHITAAGNVYSGTSGDQVTGGGGEPFTEVPYPVTLDAAEQLNELVPGCAGPR